MTVFKTFNFENYDAQISLRDQKDHSKYIGTDENWEKAESSIIEACKEKGMKARIEYGEAAFYGPKLDFMVKDAIGRSCNWVPFRWTTIFPNVSNWNILAQTMKNIVPS